MNKIYFVYDKNKLVCSNGIRKKKVVNLAFIALTILGEVLAKLSCQHNQLPNLVTSNILEFCLLTFLLYQIVVTFKLNIYGNKHFYLLCYL